MLSRLFLIVVFMAIFTVATSGGPAAAEVHVMASAAPASALGAKCEALMARDFSTTPDAPTRVSSARPVPAADGKPNYCEVQGYVAPQVGILMWLPSENWNGKFLQLGCGGFCGVMDSIQGCDKLLAKGYACITTDMGHKAEMLGGLQWAYNNPQAVVDFGYRATHVTALAGKAIVASYYGRKPDKSYFSGCSCGGRQALVEAQRFPWDFDGIIVGAPGITYSELVLGYALRAQALHDKNDKPLFDTKTIAFLGKAVVAKCDMNDGLKDGQIGDARLCKFNPREYVCKPGATSDCLTPEQADAAVAYYSERKSASGDRLGGPALLPGSEVSIVGMAETPLFPLMKRSFYEDFFKYMALNPNPGPSWKFENFDLNSDYKRMGLINSVLQADNPDLSQFKAAGGKMIFYHGWGDGGLSPLTSIEYYKKVERTMGGHAATEDFLRLFMVPDMDHCMGGSGPWSIDYLDYLEKWVEQGKAPDVMIGAHYTANPLDPMLAKDLDPANAKFTRPIYPYPLRAQYKGSGDPNSAASFKPVNSEK
jgi:feruloyl esterase